MADEDVIEFVDDVEERGNSEELDTARKQLKERCKAAGIEVVEKEMDPGEAYLSVGMPNGRDKRWISLYSLENYKSLLSVQFEKYVYLGSYDAICSYETGTIEAAIRTMLMLPSSIVKQRLEKVFPKPIEETTEGLIAEIKQNDSSDLKIRIQTASDTLAILARNPTGSPRLSIKIEGLQVNQHNKAVSLLEKVSNSLFLQIDMSVALPMSLVRDRRSRGPRRIRQSTELSAVEFPKTEYDSAPMSLYWYARSANSMPLLQFLAYYQVLEFYFFTYSQEEAKRKIRNVLKDPTFRFDREVDISRILTAVSIKGRGFGDEKSQLRATLQACLDITELRTFLSETDERKDFFSNKQKGLTSYKVGLDNKNADLRNDVTDIVYDIRCKIVHTKGDNEDGEVDLLLPFSKEAENLYQYNELMQYLARQALIHASSPIQI